MLLVESMYVDCIKMTESSVSDGEGGFITEYVDGALFSAAINLDDSIQTAIANKDSVKAVYTVTTPINAVLKFGDVIKRVEDEKIFKVVGRENNTPKISTFQFNVVKAEEWELPDVK